MPRIPLPVGVMTNSHDERKPLLPRTRLYEHPALHVERRGTTTHADLCATLEASEIGLDLFLDADTARQCVDVVLERFRALTDSPRTVDEICRVMKEVGE